MLRSSVLAGLFAVLLAATAGAQDVTLDAPDTLTVGAK